MKEIYTPEQLGQFNDFLLQRGAPVERDNIGYNMYDHTNASNIEGTPKNNAECYTLAYRMVKYCKTQLASLGADGIKMGETAQHYKKLIDEQKNKITVTDMDNHGIWCKWSYNKTITDLIKKICQPIYDGYKFVKDNSGEWVCRWKYEAIPALLPALKEICIDVSQVEASYNERVADIDASKAIKTTENIPVLTIKATRDGIDHLSLVIDPKHPSFSSLKTAIKSLGYFQWEGWKQTWKINLYEVENLINSIQTIGHLDLSQLQAWADRITWNSKFTLKDFSYLRRQPRPDQIVGAEQMLANKCHLNADEMGVGKTFECVMVGESITGKKLVVCPPSLRINWKKEIKMVNPEADIHILYSSDEYHVGDWTIIGYTSLGKFSDKLSEEEFTCMFVDEAHFAKAIKNSGEPDSERAYHVLYIAALIEYVFPVTGTPKPNRNKDLFNILRMIRHPLTSGEWSFVNYGKQYCNGSRTGYGWDFDGSSNDSDLHERIQPFMLRRLKKDVLSHLKKVRTFIPVEVDLREYHRAVEDYIESRTNPSAEHLARLIKARQILAVRKVESTVELAKNIVEQNEKVVIVTCFNEVVAKIERMFKGNVVKIVGGMSDTQKDAAIVEFQEGAAQVIVINIIAGGVGVTLTAANTVFMNDMDWVPGNHTQAEDRVCRPGQEYECNIFYPYAVGADMDETLADVLADKLDSINAAIDGGDGEDIDIRSMVEQALELKAIGMGYEPFKRRSSGKKVDATSKTPTSISEAKSNKEKPEKSKKDKKTATALDIKLKAMTFENLKRLAFKLDVTYKDYGNDGITRMWLTVALKKKINAENIDIDSIMVA